MPPSAAHRAACCLCASLLLVGLALPSANRGGPDGASEEVETDLAEELHLQWARPLPTPRPAWPEQPKMPFDAGPRLAAAQGLLFVPSTTHDSVTAFDAQTGKERWCFRANGPVRFAPVVWHDRLFVVSDDGYLYTLDIADGRLLWKFRGGPSDRMILGNGRLISTWPARGAPAVADGTVYFAAGIWPFMGIFLHALDARTGEVVWTNDGDGSVYIKQPHQADSFAGVAPQGALVVMGDRLLVPGGRSVPACYDRRTGKLLHYRLADHGKTGGGSDVVAGPNIFLNGGSAFELATGDHVGKVGDLALIGDTLLCSQSGTELRTFDLRGLKIKSEEVVDRKGKKTVQKSWSARKVGSTTVPPLEVLMRCGSRLYAGRTGEVFAIDLPLRPGTCASSWRAPIEGRPFHLLAANDRLFVSTREGRLYCFGEEPVSSPNTFPKPAAPPATSEATARAAELLKVSGVSAGHAIVWGADDADLVRELARQSQLQMIVVETDPEKAESVRTQLEESGLYGERVSVHIGEPDTVQLPPYLATLMIAGTADRSERNSALPHLRQFFSLLRPHGGVACLTLTSTERSDAAAQIRELAQAKLDHVGTWTLLKRMGPLPGSANWTHEHADAANTRVSRDTVVKAPLGLLWFGGPSNDTVLPRHGHGPQPQVLDGRMILEGVDMLRALDLYTGRLLWETHIPGVGKAYDNLAHQPGANAGGGNYVSTCDGIYVAHGTTCLLLDPETGLRKGEFHLRATRGGPPTWDYLNVADDALVAGANPPMPEKTGRPAAVSSSQHLMVLDRHNGQVRWTADARAGFRHNAICIGGDRLYAIDRPSADHLARLERRGLTAVKPRLMVFDLHTGKVVWSTEANVFGTWLSYSAKHDIVVESGRVARDTLTDEPKGMRAYDARTGKVLWDRKDHVGPAMIHSDIILKDRSACDLRTGAPVLRDDPLTGERLEWTWSRTYGCNTPMASEHLLTFRSGAAGYYDLCRDSGTANLGGFRSGCTNNLVVAGGLLCAPDYTRTCTCSYQNQTSIALVPVAKNEQWSYLGTRDVKGPVRRAGINLGAPGGRKADDGIWWLEHPAVGGPSPKVTVQTEPANITWFRRHESQIKGEGHAWVAGSGGRGIRSVVVKLAADRVERPYTVRLTFLEPERLTPGERIFDVTLQDQPVLSALDIVAEAGGPLRGVTREFRGIRIAGDLRVTLTPTDPESSHEPILSGIEVLAEGW